MKNHLRKSYFTLVEVLIAMGICVVGVVSIMGLFPVGANTARDANMAFYADQTADQMLHLTKYMLLDKDLNANLKSSLHKYFFEMITGWTIDNTSTYSNQTKPSDSDEPSVSASWTNVAAVASTSLSKSYVDLLANAGTTVEVGPSGWQLYRMKFVTKDSGNDYEDFSCIVRLWAERMLGDVSTPLPRAATFHIEVSWPADLPYERRQKAEYSIDVFVPEW